MLNSNIDFMLTILDEVLQLDFGRFFLPDSKAFPPGAVSAKRLLYDRLLIMLEGSKDEHMSVNGEFQLVQLKPGDAMFFHKEAWEEQNFRQKQRLLCIIPMKTGLRLSYYDTEGQEGVPTSGGASCLTENVPIPAFFDTMRAIGCYGTQNSGHIFHLIRAAVELAKQECLRERNTRIERGRMNYTKIYAYLEDNYMNPLSRAGIARHFNLTETYISILFSQYGKKTLIQQLQDIRLSAAAELLNSCNWSVKEIAFQCGFASDIYFIRCFRSRYHVSPGEFRKNSNILSEKSE